VTVIPSFQSHGTWPVLQTDRNMEWSARATGMIANLSNSAGMPSGPGARPFFNLRIAAMTSLRDGSSMKSICLQRRSQLRRPDQEKVYLQGGSMLLQSVLATVLGFQFQIGKGSHQPCE